MTIHDYLKKLEYIREREFMSATGLVRALDISHNTFIKIKRFPDTCSLQTMKKIKRFVDEWESKNVSLLH